MGKQFHSRCFFMPRSEIEFHLCDRQLVALPAGVSRPVGADLLGSGVDIVDAGLSLIDALEGIVLGWDPRVCPIGEGIFGHGLDVTSLDEVVQRLRRLLLVDRIGIDRAAQGPEIFFQNGLSGMPYALDVHRNGDSGQQADDDHDDHQLDQGKALLEAACASWSRSYHVEYFEPSRAVP